MKIDDSLICYLEDLSYLTLSDAEKGRLQEDLQDILGYMSTLEALEPSDMAEQNHPLDQVNGFREDEVCGSLDRRLILKNAPQDNGEAFVVPKVVE